MPQLLNQFDLRPGITRARFEAAWHPFIAHLVERGLATGAGPILTRQAESGFDTDEARGQTLMALIHFADAVQARAAWDAIEADQRPLCTLHRKVFAMVANPVFTYWEE